MSNYRNQDPYNRYESRMPDPQYGRRGPTPSDAVGAARSSSRNRNGNTVPGRNRAENITRHAGQSDRNGSGGRSAEHNRTRHSSDAALDPRGYSRPRVNPPAAQAPRNRTATGPERQRSGGQTRRRQEAYGAHDTSYNRAAAPESRRPYDPAYRGRGSEASSGRLRTPAPTPHRTEASASRVPSHAAPAHAHTPARRNIEAPKADANRRQEARTRTQAYRPESFEAETTTRPSRRSTPRSNPRTNEASAVTPQETARPAASSSGKAGSAIAGTLSKGGRSIGEAASSLKTKFSTWAASEPQASSNPEKKASQKSNEIAGPHLVVSEQQAAELAPWHDIASKVFGGVLVAGLALGLCFFLRPSVSQVENRELTQFPKPSLDSLVSGSFTEGISTWYADTYPFRDQLISVNQALKGLYGFESDTQMYGSSVQGDDIPDADAKAAATQDKDPVAPETYDSWNLEEDIQGQIMQGLYVDNGAVYATYGFTQEAADDYVNAVNKAADKLDGTTQVYSILIPNNSGVLLSKDELAALGGSNQGQAIQYYYDSYNDKVKTVQTMKPLVDHKDEYIYFRTDHHWTSLAAYYVYREFCSQKGMEPHDIATYEEKDFSPFLGSYYSQLQLESLTKDPDTVQAWIPKGTNDLTYTDVDGNTIDWNVIKDVSDWDQGTQYNCFVGGDQPWAEIHNPEITDGSSCLIVKESYGNAFVPWLVDHYENVYIVDFRYNNDNVVEICKEKEVDDLILLNNISIIGSVDVAGKIASIL